jgi:DNA polymerase-3 subunit delta'
MDLFGEPSIPSDFDQSPVGDMIAAESIDLPAPVSLLGHKDIEDRLVQAINAGRLPHGLVFSGLQGIGKYKMALKLARVILSQNGGNTLPITTLDEGLDPLTVRRMNNNAHPDFMLVTRAYDEKKNRYKDNVSVDSVRRVPAFLQRTASEGGWRVVIVDDANTMNRNAQNAILKILEEPPKKTILILVVHRLGVLLPTIRSRVQVFDFSPLSRETIKTILDEELSVDLDEDILNFALDFAGGSASHALDFIQNGGGDILNLVRQHGFESQDWPARHACAESLGRGKNDGDYKMFMALVLWCVEQCIRIKSTCEQGFSDNLVFLEGFFKRHDLKALLRIYDALSTHNDRVVLSNLDKCQGILGTFMILDS